MHRVIRSTWNNSSSVITSRRSGARFVAETRSIINWLIMFNYGNNSDADKNPGGRCAKISAEIS